ncbi:MAG: hypothetical protein OXB88_04740 [Bacteriovoracales bacterium]|nr:hypothetical protein [Bacteriovoracales bacterium]
MMILPHGRSLRLFPLLVFLFSLGSGLPGPSSSLWAGSSVERRIPRGQGHALALLRRAKVMMFYGQLKRAKRILETLDPASSPLSLSDGKEAIRQRYLALISVAQGQWEKTLTILETPSLGKGKGRPYEKTCPLGILAKTVLGKAGSFEEDFFPCFVEYFRSERLDLSAVLRGIREGSLWGRREDMASTLSLSLQLAHHLGEEKKVPEGPDSLLGEAEGQEYPPRLRETLGLWFYRAGDDEKAQDFLQGLEFPEALNALGNLALTQGQYDEAEEFFHSVLKEHKSSLSAVERSIPLAWIKRNFSYGQGLLNSMSRLRSLNRKETLLLSALMTEKGEAKKALKIMARALHIGKNRNIRPTPLSVSLEVFNHLMTGQSKRGLLGLMGICSQGHITACSFLGPFSRGENGGRFLGRLLEEKKEEPIPTPGGIDLDELFEKKMTSPKENLAEFHDTTKPFIDQWDIERMDSMEQKEWFSKRLWERSGF